MKSEKKNVRIAHFADIHWRGLTRHKEYREVFSKIFEMLREQKPDIIYIGGDIVHSKTQGISPELIDALVWMFTGFANIAPTEVILGNHDGILLNKDRQDTITPIITALSHPNIKLYKESGTYPIGIPGFSWNVFSCFDEDNWSKVRPKPGDINIALFHGGVLGSTTDIDWHIEGEVDVNFFERFDFALLGDIHKVQFLNPKKTVAYCGSTVQQNYGEDTNKGYLLWDIRDKDDFDVNFHKVEGPKPFVTVNWEGNVQKTLKALKDLKDGSRVRIRTKESIPSVEWKQLCNELEILKAPSEVVSKDERLVDTQQISTEAVTLFKNDLKDPDVIVNLLEEYFKESSLSEKDWNDLEALTRSYVKSISRSGSLSRNHKWSVKKLEFDNTFSYGKGNVIDFDSMNGITGIFGRNARGKSSIVGALMYCLFNTTDRGPIKNLHVINTRKDYCRAKATIQQGENLLRVERQSVKNKNAKGHESALTHLNIFKIDNNGNELADLSKEQRRVTERDLREKFGTSDDFLLTSLASQGEINAFIKQRSTARKHMLTRFLGLDIFENLFNLAKEESREIQTKVKSAPDRDWDSLIHEAKNEIKDLSSRVNSIEDELSEMRLDEQKLQIKLSKFENADVVTCADVERQQTLTDSAKKSLENLITRRNAIFEKIENLEVKIKKIQEVKESTSIEDLKASLKNQRALGASLVQIKHSHEKEQTLLKSQLRSVAKLKDVPCGDSFPMCKFIKDSHKDKQKIEAQEEKIKALLEHIENAQEQFDQVMSEDLEDKIDKYEKIMRMESTLKIELTQNQSNAKSIKRDIESLESKITQSEQDLEDLKSKMVDSDIDQELNNLKARLYEEKSLISSKDAKRISCASSIGRLEVTLQNLKSEKSKYQKLKQKWRIYEYFIQAVSKRGLPLQIIMSQLPVINAEVSKILQGVVSFTVELEADPNSNSMDVYINYGDSKRVIEVASGMEKMISSLAIRVALINISSLPKTDMLIIDEGFGSLDDVNVEACNRLLVSLKKWFKNIIIITHVDGVKDVVDNVIDITWEGKDAKVVYE